MDGHEGIEKLATGYRRGKTSWFDLFVATLTALHFLRGSIQTAPRYFCHKVAVIIDQPSSVGELFSRCFRGEAIIAESAVMQVKVISSEN